MGVVGVEDVGAVLGAVHEHVVQPRRRLGGIALSAQPADVLAGRPEGHAVRLHDVEDVLPTTVGNDVREVVALHHVGGPAVDVEAATVVAAALGDRAEGVLPLQGRQSVVAAILVDQRHQVGVEGGVGACRTARGEHRRAEHGGPGATQTAARAIGRGREARSDDAHGLPRVGPTVADSFGSPAVSRWRPVALRPLLAEGWPLSGADAPSLAVPPDSAGARTKALDGRDTGATKHHRSVTAPTANA